MILRIDARRVGHIGRVSLNRGGGPPRVHMGARLTRIAPRANKRPNREATIEMASHT
jgi:hypothetical protein